MTRVAAGIDGCRKGWVAVLVQWGRSGPKEVQYRVAESFEGILHIDHAPDVIAIDIPIGLLEERVVGGRECDRLARQKLGRPRASSVFSPPIRRALHAKSYPEAALWAQSAELRYPPQDR